MNEIRTFLGSMLALTAVSCGHHPSVSQEEIACVRDFIRTSWDASVQYNPTDSQTLIGLPRPYTVPSVSQTFQELYYWDTYFTNEGLVRDGRLDLAKNNTEDMLYLVDRYGYMPNGSRTWYLNRSQPPFLCMMVDRIFEQTEDTNWLAGAFTTLQKEYDFWMTQRITPVGLNRYSSSASDELKQEFVTTGGQRLNTFRHGDSATGDAFCRRGRVGLGLQSPFRTPLCRFLSGRPQCQSLYLRNALRPLRPSVGRFQGCRNVEGTGRKASRADKPLLPRGGWCLL